jgi:hypothetical protein
MAKKESMGMDKKGGGMGGKKSTGFSAKIGKGAGMSKKMDMASPAKCK